MPLSRDDPWLGFRLVTPRHGETFFRENLIPISFTLIFFFFIPVIIYFIISFAVKIAITGTPIKRNLLLFFFFFWKNTVAVMCFQIKWERKKKSKTFSVFLLDFVQFYQNFRNLIEFFFIFILFSPAPSLLHNFVVFCRQFFPSWFFFKKKKKREKETKKFFILFFCPIWQTNI